MTFATVHRLYAAKDTAAILVRGLSLSYRGRPALKDVTLPVYGGRITALVGPSGCGKTSLLMSINRMTDHVPDCTTTGAIDALGHDVLSPRCDLVALRKQVGMIFQRPNPFPLSIAKNLDFPLREHGVRDRVERQTRIECALRDVGLWREVKDRLGANALTLSGGQQQRLCFARALALRPDVLLLDEPCSALDPMASGIVEDLIVTLRGRYTLVVVTHNMAQARRIADYVGVFWPHEGAGRLVEFGARAQIFDDPEHELTRAYVAGIRG